MLNILKLYIILVLIFSVSCCNSVYLKQYVFQVIYFSIKIWMILHQFWCSSYKLCIIFRSFIIYSNNSSSVLIVFMYKRFLCHLWFQIYGFKFNLNGFKFILNCIGSNTMWYRCVSQSSCLLQLMSKFITVHFIICLFATIVAQLRMHYFSGWAFASLISSQLLKKGKYIWKYNFPNSAWRVTNFLLPTQ